METRWNGQGHGWLPLGVSLLLASACAETVAPSDDGGDDESTGASVESTDTTAVPGDTTAPETNGTTDDDPPPPVLDCVAEQSWAIDDFLNKQCAGCHNTTGSASAVFDYVDDLGQMIASRKIVPGSAEDSDIYRRIAAGTMPPTGVPMRPSDEEIARFGTYINECFTDNPTCEPAEAISINQVLEDIEEDITLSNIDDRPFIRYFVFTHLYNLGYCPEDLKVQRDAAVKLLNSLSNQVRLVDLEPVDDDGTILRFDIRDVGWDEPVGVFADKWEALVAASPYSVERLEDEAETIKAFTQTAVPFVLGNAFIDIASEAPLYHDLAGIPATLGELEDLLALDIQQNILDEEVQRAGVLVSGIATQNRVVERHEIQLAANRVLWLTYDFVDDSQNEQDIFEEPLNFVQELSTVIFSLPNGLHAYMIVDGQGNRLDEAPDVIIIDATQDDRDVHNGISCFRCHTTFQPVVDEVRAFVVPGLEFDQATKDIVREIYPLPDDFQDFLEIDQITYDNSLTRLGLETGSLKEPISASFIRYQLNVNLKIAAAELFLDPKTLEREIGGLSVTLSTLGDENGTVKRDTWSELFADTVCRLNLGLADDDDCL